ncbi:putative Ig domain-containing protein [Patescibacteria group bacterium]
MPSKDSIFNQKGFTLIELVIAIAIIGALSGVLTFVINPEKQKNTASDAVIMSSLVKSKLSAEAYINSYGRYPNEEEFFNSISKTGKQRNDNACEISGLPDNECLFNIDGVDTPETCDEDGWFGDPQDMNKCFFRYKGGINGEKDRYRVSVKTHGLSRRILIFDNKLDGNIYECPWPLTDNLNFEDCNIFGIEKRIEQAQGWGWGLFGGGGEDDNNNEIPLTDLELDSVCSIDPNITRRWRVRNTNDVEVETYWNVLGSTQASSFLAPKAGSGSPPDDISVEYNYTFFDTDTVGGSNATKIWWYDYDSQEHEIIKDSTGQYCEQPFSCDDSGLNITTVSIPEGVGDELYSAQIDGTGGTAPYTWEIVKEETTVPGYFAIDQSKGIITGTPDNAPGTYTLTIKVTDSKDCYVEKSFNIYLNPQNTELPYDIVILRGRLINRFTKEPISGARFQWVTNPDNPDFYRQIDWEPWTKYDATWSDDNGNFEIDLPYPLMLGRNTGEQVVSIQAYGCSSYNNDIRLRNTDDESLYEMGFKLLDKIPQHETSYIKVNSDDYNIGDVELWPHAYAYIKSDVAAGVDYEYPEDAAHVSPGNYHNPIPNSGKYTQGLRAMLAKHYDTVLRLSLPWGYEHKTINYNIDEDCGGGMMVEIKDGEITIEYGVPDEEDIIVRFVDPNIP